MKFTNFLVALPALVGASPLPNKDYYAEALSEAYAKRNEPDPSAEIQVVLLFICATALLCLAGLNCWECLRAHNIHNAGGDFEKSVAAIVKRQKSQKKEAEKQKTTRI